MQPLTYIDVDTGRIVEVVGDPFGSTVRYRYQGMDRVHKLSANLFYRNGQFVACKPPKESP